MDDVKGDEESNFCEQMLAGCHDWFTDIEVCGSFAELPLDFIVTNVTDIDVLISLKDVVAVSDQKKEAYLTTTDGSDLNLLETKVFVDTANTHAGFAQLKRGDLAYLLRRKLKMPQVSSSHGPAMLVDFFRKNYRPSHYNLSAFRIFFNLHPTNWGLFGPQAYKLFDYSVGFEIFDSAFHEFVHRTVSVICAINCLGTNYLQFLINFIQLGSKRTPSLAKFAFSFPICTESRILQFHTTFREHFFTFKWRRYRDFNSGSLIGRHLGF